VKKLNEHIGIHIKKIRNLKGITQQQLAESIGKTRPLVSYFERTGIINKYTLQEIANALDISTEYIENFDNINFHNVNKKGTYPKLSIENESAHIQSLQLEINFLKSTIEQQWKLIFELSKSK